MTQAILVLGFVLALLCAVAAQAQTCGFTLGQVAECKPVASQGRKP